MAIMAPRSEEEAAWQKWNYGGGPGTRTGGDPAPNNYNQTNFDFSNFGWGNNQSQTNNRLGGLANLGSFFRNRAQPNQQAYNRANPLARFIRQQQPKATTDRWGIMPGGWNRGDITRDNLPSTDDIMNQYYPGGDPGQQMHLTDLDTTRRVAEESKQYNQFRDMIDKYRQTGIAPTMDNRMSEAQARQGYGKITDGQEAFTNPDSPSYIPDYGQRVDLDKLLKKSNNRFGKRGLPGRINRRGYLNRDRKSMLADRIRQALRSRSQRGGRRGLGGLGQRAPQNLAQRSPEMINQLSRLLGRYR